MLFDLKQFSHLKSYEDIAIKKQFKHVDANRLKSSFNFC